jgi:hypothetical protein
MSWNGKFISLDRVVEKVFQDEGYEHELDWGDVLEWTGEALGLIGAPAIYIDKITGMHPATPNVIISQYRGELPIDFINPLPAGVRNYDTAEVYREATDTFAIAPGTQTYNTTSGLKENTRNIHTINNEKTYVLKDNYIYVNDEDSVTLELAYKAFKIDDRGFPMIPDNDRVIKCIASCITYHTDHRLWRKNKISSEVYAHSEREYLWYIGSAGTAMRIPHPDKRESMTKAFVRLNPVINAHMSSFKFTGNQEDLNIGSGNRDGTLR